MDLSLAGEDARAHTKGKRGGYSEGGDGFGDSRMRSRSVKLGFGTIFDLKIFKANNTNPVSPSLASLACLCAAATPLKLPAQPSTAVAATRCRQQLVTNYLGIKEYKLLGKIY